MAQDSGEVIPAADTERLRAQIEETRTEMSETIDAIQDRLRPGRLMTDAKASVKEATVGRVRDLAIRVGDTAAGLAAHSSDARATVMSAVRRNPVPAALIGASAGLVFVYALKRSARIRRGAESAMTPELEGLMIP
jgi:hypothetical protein